MPTHEFVCDDCGVRIEDNTTKEIHRCYKCGKDMRWDSRVAIHSNYDRPIVSDALAINPEQIPEHRRLFPNIEVRPDGRPVFDNFTDHEGYMKKCGIIKQPQKSRGIKSKKATRK